MKKKKKKKIINWKATVGWRGVGLSKLWGFGSRKKIKSTSSEPTSLFQKKIFPAQKPRNSCSCPRTVFFTGSALIESYYGLYLHINAMARRPFGNHNNSCFSFQNLNNCSKSIVVFP